MKRLLIFCIAILSCLSVSAQKDTASIKFANVTPADFEPTDFEYVGGYKAVILQNQRSIYFDVFLGDHTNSPLNSTFSYLRFVNTYHIRYKALEDNFLVDNKFVIPFSGRYDYEIVPKVKAEVFTYNGSKVVSKKVKFGGIKTVNRDSLHSRVEITFPEIKKGDIVDIEYTVASYDYLNPEKWSFHHEYPCLVSQVVTDFPDNISYDLFVTGESIHVSKTVKPETVVFYADNAYYAQYNSRATDQLSYRLPGERTIFTALNTMPVDTVFKFLPQKDYNDAQLYLRPRKFTDENTANLQGWSRLTSMLRRYADPSCRYMSQFEVSRMTSVDAYVTLESGNWKRFNKRQRQSPVFWKPILQAFQLFGKLAEIYDNADGLDSLSLLKQIYGYVTSNVKWDSTFANYIANKPEIVLQKGRGSSGEINGTLVSLLRRAGFNALPVYSATRDFGTVDSTYANTLQFNNILAYVAFTQNDSLYTYLIDATSPTRSFDVLNTVNINNLYLAMDLDKSTHSFLCYPPNQNNEREVSAELKDGGCVVSEKSTGVFAAENSDFLYFHNAKRYFDSRFYFDASDVQQISSSNSDGVFEFSAQIPLSKVGEKALMRKLVGPNPFPELVRTVPVDFVFPRKYRFVVYSKAPLTVPEQSFDACGHHLSAHIYSNVSDGLSALHLDVDISRTMFSVAEYDYLRMFFANIYKFLGN